MSAEPSAGSSTALDDASAARRTRFAARATTVSTDVRGVPRADVSAALTERLRAARADSVLLDSAVADVYPELPAALRGAGLAVVDHAAPREALAAVAAGISLAAFGIAETGSVALASTALADRLAGMLPPLHVVLLGESDLLDDLDAAGERLRAWTTAEPPRPYLSFVTGPSRTADIERVLTIGVQGPRALCVLLVEDA